MPIATASDDLAWCICATGVNWREVGLGEGISLFLPGNIVGNRHLHQKAEQASGKKWRHHKHFGKPKAECGGDDYERVSLTFRHLLDTRRMLSSGSKPDVETATETRIEMVATACPEQKGRMGGWVTRATKNFQISGQGFGYGIDLWIYIDFDFFS